MVFYEFWIKGGIKYFYFYENEIWYFYFEIMEVCIKYIYFYFYKKKILDIEYSFWKNLGDKFNDKGML